MTAVYSLLAPVFVLILVGGLAVRSGLFSASGLPALNRFVLIICVPVLIFSALSQVGSFSAMNWPFIFLFAGLSLVTNACVALFLKLLWRYKTVDAIVLSFGAGTPNSIFLGYPIASLIDPNAAATIFAWYIVGDTLIVIPLMTALAEGVSTGPRDGFLRRLLLPLLRNPVLIGLAIGAAFLLVGQPLPEALDTARRSLAAAANPLALFIIGGMVVSTKPESIGGTVAVIATAKLVVFPLAMALILWMVPVVDPLLVPMVILFAAMPMFTIYGVLAERHGQGAPASSALLITTVLGGVTVGITLWTLGFG